jgi:hypothetical protein
MSTLYLNPETWDLAVDVNGNIALAEDPYASAQDAASQATLFIGELLYDTTQGVSWWNILGELPPIEYVRAQLVAAALLVPNVTAAQVYFSSFSQRAISGQLQVTVAGYSTPGVASF